MSETPRAKAIYASEEVHTSLKIQAAQARKPMNEYLKELLEQEERK